VIGTPLLLEWRGFSVELEIEAVSSFMNHVIALALGAKRAVIALAGSRSDSIIMVNTFFPNVLHIDLFLSETV
jgi:hypothetical protein